MISNELRDTAEAHRESSEGNPTEEIEMDNSEQEMDSTPSSRKTRNVDIQLDSPDDNVVLCDLIPEVVSVDSDDNEDEISDTSLRDICQLEISVLWSPNMMLLFLEVEHTCSRTDVQSGDNLRCTWYDARASSRDIGRAMVQEEHPRFLDTVANLEPTNKFCGHFYTIHPQIWWHGVSESSESNRNACRDSFPMKSVFDSNVTHNSCIGSHISFESMQRIDYLSDAISRRFGVPEDLRASSISTSCRVFDPDTFGRVIHRFGILANNCLNCLDERGIDELTSIIISLSKTGDADNPQKLPKYLYLQCLIQDYIRIRISIIDGQRRLTHCLMALINAPSLKCHLSGKVEACFPSQTIADDNETTLLDQVSTLRGDFVSYVLEKKGNLTRKILSTRQIRQEGDVLAKSLPMQSL